MQLGLTNPTLSASFESTKATKFIQAKHIQDIITNKLSHLLAPHTLPETSTPFSITPILPYSSQHSQRTSGRGRGRGRSQPSTPPHSQPNLPPPLFKISNIGSIIDLTANMKHHAIFNGIGGSSTANIYYCHFDISVIRLLVNRIPYNRYQSYDTFPEAMKAMTHYFPNCHTKDDLDKMNINAPLEASNLNNPSPIIRQQVGDYQLKRKTTKEHYWLHNLFNPTVKACRLASSRRMATKGAQPTDSYDFLDEDFSQIQLSFPMTTVTLTSIEEYIKASKSNPNINTTTPPSQDLLNAPMQTIQPPDNNDTSSRMDITHINTPTQQLEDDAISHLSTISISGSALQSSQKRPRHSSNTSTAPVLTQNTIPQQPTLTQQFQHTPTFVNFITDASMHPNTIRTELTNAYNTSKAQSNPNPDLQCFPFPGDAIASAIHFSMIPGNEQLKLGHIQVLIPAHINEIVSLTKTLHIVNEVFPSTFRPATGYNISHIDMTEPKNKKYPTNCRIIGCQLHNLGFEQVPQSLSTTDLAHHMYKYHRDLLESLPTDILNKISWYSCTGCNLRFFTEEVITEHTESCQYIRNTRQYKGLFDRCPPQHIQELHELINSNTNIVEITTKLLDWKDESFADL